MYMKMERKVKERKTETKIRKAGREANEYNTARQVRFRIHKKHELEKKESEEIDVHKGGTKGEGR